MHLVRVAGWLVLAAAGGFLIVLGLQFRSGGCGSTDAGFGCASTINGTGIFLALVGAALICFAVYRGTRRR